MFFLTLHRSFLGTKEEERMGFCPVLGDWIWELRNATGWQKQFITSEVGTSELPLVCHPGGCQALLIHTFCLIPTPQTLQQDFNVQGQNCFLTVELPPWQGFLYLCREWGSSRKWLGSRPDVGSFHLYLLRAEERKPVCVRPLHETRRNLSTQGAKWVENPKAIRQLLWLVYTEMERKHHKVSGRGRTHRIFPLMSDEETDVN